MSLLDEFRLDGKVAVCPGASNGLGVSFAQVMADGSTRPTRSGPFATSPTPCT